MAITLPEVGRNRVVGDIRPGQRLSMLANPRETGPRRADLAVGKPSARLRACSEPFSGQGLAPRRVNGLRAGFLERGFVESFADCS